MADNFKNYYNGINLRPLGVDPSNPKEGDIFRSNGTPRAQGLWEYKASAWQPLQSLNNLSAAVAPTVNEDSDDGYVVGSLWIDTTADKIYRCVDATVGAAVWKEIVDTDSTQTFTAKTLTSPVLNTGVSGTAIDTDDTLAANSDTIIPSQQAVKGYADVIAGNLTTHVGLSTAHGSGSDIVGKDQSVTLTNKTLTSPVINSSVSGTAIKDEDNMVSDSATHLCTQQSIKAYVDTFGGGGGGGLTQSIVTADTTMVDNYQYIANKSGTALAFTLPASPVVGTQIQIIGQSTTGWTLFTNASATAQIVGWKDLYSTASSSSAVQVGASQERFGSVILTCVVGGASATWIATDATYASVGSGIPYYAGVSAHWTLDETTGSFLDSKNSYDILRYGAVSSIAGKFENAASGFANAIYARNNWSGFEVLGGTSTAKVTVEAWVRFSTLATSVQYILTNTATYAAATNTLRLYATTTSLAWGALGGVFVTYNITGLDDGNWHYVVGTIDNTLGSERVKLYLDGTKVAFSNTADSYPAADGYITIGGHNAANEWWRGDIDDVVYWIDAAMSAAQVTERYNAGVGRRYY